MQAVCGDNGIPSREQNAGALGLRCPWFNDASVQGLMARGIEYLNHVLSDEQLSLYRVVTRDAHRFPELGLRYHREVVSGRTEIFVKYTDHCVHINSAPDRGRPRPQGSFRADPSPKIDSPRGLDRRSGSGSAARRRHPGGCDHGNIRPGMLRALDTRPFLPRPEDARGEGVCLD